MSRRILVLAVTIGATNCAGAAAQSNIDVALVQENLRHYRTREATGILDAATRRAIRAYQYDWNIPQTGNITPELIAMLTRRHDRTKPQWYRVANQNCAVWNPGPAPRATATWSGQCNSGRTSGAGQLVWTFLRYNRSIRYVYDGQRRDGKAEGSGRMSWHDGSYYLGDWKNDARHGQGTMVWAGGERAGMRYVGSWRRDKPHGNGTLIWSNGNRELRQWIEGCSERDGQRQVIATTMKSCGFAPRR